jgi:hypothetical protein
MAGKYIGPIQLRLSGDENLASRYVGPARVIVQEMAEQMSAFGTKDLIRRELQPDGTHITAHVMEFVKGAPLIQVYIDAPVIAPITSLNAEFEALVPFYSDGTLVLSGGTEHWVSDGGGFKRITTDFYPIDVDYQWSGNYLNNYGDMLFLYYVRGDSTAGIPSRAYEKVTIEADDGSLSMESEDAEPDWDAGDIAEDASSSNVELTMPNLGYETYELAGSYTLNDPGCANPTWEANYEIMAGSSMATTTATSISTTPTVTTEICFFGSATSWRSNRTTTMSTDRVAVRKRIS